MTRRDTGGNRRRPTGEHRGVADTLMTTIAPMVEPMKVLVIEGAGPLKAAARPILALAALAGVAWGGWLWAQQSPYFTLREVQLEPTPHVSREDALGLAGLGQPVNAFRFDADAARDHLLGDPWVATAEVEVKLPDKVSLTWTERTPAAVAFIDGALFLVDAAGLPFVEIGLSEAGALPIITGVTRARYETEPVRTRGRIRAALQLARDYQASALARHRPLSNAHVGEGLALELMLGRTRVALGDGHYAEKLHRLEAIDRKLAERGMDAAYILMETDGDRAIVKEITPEAAPPRDGGA